MTLRNQITTELRRRILAGDLPEGSAIPSERDLAEEYNVSRMTARAAIESLVDDGLLVRRQGQRATVAGLLAEKISRTAAFMSFSDEMRLHGWQTTSRVVKIMSTLADASTAAQLDLDIGASVIYVERVRLADGVPLALERVFLPFKRFQRLLDYDLAENSLYEVLERDFGVRPAYAEESVEAVALDSDDAAVFDLPAGALALLSRRITRDEQDRPVEAVTTIYRGDKYRMRLTRRR